MRNEISTSNPNHISKHRYLELKHFCLQYPEWKKEYARLSLMRSNSVIFPNGDKNWSDITGENASFMADLAKKIEKVEKTASSVDPVLGDYILEGVTSGKSYDYLRTVKGIPCCRNTYYELYRIFFNYLSRR